MISFQHKTTVKVIVHSLFWAFYMVILFVFDTSYDECSSLSWYEKIDYDLVLLAAGVTYLNELYLLPVFFKRKLYLPYALIVFVLLFFAIVIYCNYLSGQGCTFAVCFSDYIWIIALPLVFLSFIWVVIQFFEKQKELEKVSNDRLKLELKFLKAQINPHVLFNSLNTIYAQAIKDKDNDAIAEMILMLSDNLKYVLNQSDDVFVGLEKDIDFIENHLKFQGLRTQGINNIIYKKEIDSYEYSIAPLILIDLIENAFKYTLYKDNELSEISIELTINKGELHFVCKNEFDPDSIQEKEKSTEIGLKNLRQRLQLIYGSRHRLSINKDHGVFIVDLKINLI